MLADLVLEVSAEKHESASLVAPEGRRCQRGPSERARRGSNERQDGPALFTSSEPVRESADDGSWKDRVGALVLDAGGGRL